MVTKALTLILLKTPPIKHVYYPSNVGKTGQQREN
jgi:hypothetical protein